MSKLKHRSRTTMETVPDAHIPACHPHHEHCKGRNTQAQPNTPPPENPCNTHRCSPMEKQPTCPGIQVHLHNHACPTPPKQRQATQPVQLEQVPRHICTKTQRPSHICGHSGQIIHPCLKQPRAPYPHSGRCSENIDFPAEPDTQNHNAKYAAKRECFHNHSDFHGQKSLPLHGGDIAWVWGPPSPVWEGRSPCGRGNR